MGVEGEAVVEREGPVLPPISVQVQL